MFIKVGVSVQVLFTEFWNFLCCFTVILATALHNPEYFAKYLIKRFSATFKIGQLPYKPDKAERQSECDKLVAKSSQNAFTYYSLATSPSPNIYSTQKPNLSPKTA